LEFKSPTKIVQKLLTNDYSVTTSTHEPVSRSHVYVLPSVGRSVCSTHDVSDSRHTYSLPSVGIGVGAAHKQEVSFKTHEGYGFGEINAQ
jgi:hypothetical protein